MSYTQVSLPAELVAQLRDVLKAKGIKTDSNADAVKYVIRREIEGQSKSEPMSMPPEIIAEHEGEGRNK